MAMTPYQLSLLREYIDLRALVEAREAANKPASKSNYQHLDDLWERIEEDNADTSGS